MIVNTFLPKATYDSINSMIKYYNKNHKNF